MATATSLNLGPVRDHVRAVAIEINSRFSVPKIYGFANRNIAGTNTLSDHARGLALDFMTYDDRSKGHAIASYLVEHANRLNITYIIWNRRIWRRGKWKGYGGVNPHTDHIHVSFSSGNYNPIDNPNGDSGGINLPGPFDEIYRGLKNLSDFVNDPNAWLRVGMFIAGLILLIISLIGATNVPKIIKEAV